MMKIQFLMVIIPQTKSMALSWLMQMMELMNATTKSMPRLKS
jgi:hypothetical protein